MYKTYNRIYTKPKIRNMTPINTERISNKPTSPKTYYDAHTNTLLLQYTYMRICLRDHNTRYELGYHYEYTKRTITIKNPSDTKLTELAITAITRDLEDSGLSGLTFDYYYMNNSGIPNPWVYHYGTDKDDEIVTALFHNLDLNTKQILFVQPGFNYFKRLLNEQKLPNGKTLGSYGKWMHTRKPLDSYNLIGIAYTPKAEY